jgi:hypothetical protein
VDAFNLLNHQIITGVNSSYTSFLAPGGSAKVGSSIYACPASSSAPNTQGCFVPSTNTGLSAFGVPSSTSSSNLYGARQLQFAAKFLF